MTDNFQDDLVEAPVVLRPGPAGQTPAAPLPYSDPDYDEDGLKRGFANWGDGDEEGPAPPAEPVAKKPRDVLKTPIGVKAGPKLSDEELSQYGLGQGAAQQYGPPNPHTAEGAAQLPEAEAPSGASGGGSYSSSYSAQGNPFIGQLRRDYDEQLQGMSNESAARGAMGQTQAGELGHIADQKREWATEMRDRAESRAAEARTHLDEIGALAQDYANQKIDPYKLTKDQNWLGKIGTIVGAMGAGWVGGPKGAADYLGALVDKSIALQQDEIHRKGRALYEADNLFHNFLKVTGDEDLAYDKSKALLLDAAMTDAQKAAIESGIPVQSAQMQQFMASLKLQRDTVLAKIQASVSGSGRGGAGAGSGSGYIPIEGGNQVVTLPNGQEVYVGRGGEDVTKAVETSSRAATEAAELSQYVKDRPDFLHDPVGYQNWHAGLRQRLKSLSVMESNHLGQGSRSSLGLLQVYKDAIVGPAGSETTFAGPVDAAKMHYQAAQIEAAADNLAAQAEADSASILKTHSGITGRTVLVPQREKGMIVQKPMFQAGPAFKEAAKSDKAPAQKRLQTLDK